MSSTDQFLISLQVYQESQSNQHSPEETAVFLDPSPFQELPIASGPLLLGQRADGHPLTIDLHDPASGPFLVAGDPGCGRTSLMRSLADAASALLDVQFAVLTPFPEEWRLQETSPACLGVWPVYHPYAADFLARFVSWAQVLPRTRQVILLFVDDLDMLHLEPTVLQPLQWLLKQGTEMHIWTFLGHNLRRTGCFEPLLGYFTSRILGKSSVGDILHCLPENTENDLASLQPGRDFILQEGNRSRSFSIDPVIGG